MAFCPLATCILQHHNRHWGFFRERKGRGEKRTRRGYEVQVVVVELWVSQTLSMRRGQLSFGLLALPKEDFLHKTWVSQASQCQFTGR